MFFQVLIYFINHDFFIKHFKLCKDTNESKLLKNVMQKSQTQFVQIYTKILSQNIFIIKIIKAKGAIVMTYYDFNNQNSDMQNMPDNNQENASQEKETKKKSKKGFTAGVLVAALALGMGGGAASYAGLNMLSNTNQSAAVQTTQQNTTASMTAISNNDSSSGSTVADVAQSAIKSLVSLSTSGEMTQQGFFGYNQVYEFSAAGSGVIVSKDDENIYIATNNHVIDSANSIKATFADGSEYDATVVGADSSNDIAVVSVPVSELSEDTLNAISVATIGDSDELVLGEQVVAIGNALGYGQSVTSGYISAFDRSLTLGDSSGNTMESTGLVQTDASINSGDSGGGLFNMNGELVAINEAKSSTTSSGVTVDNMGYAIPMAKALPIINSMIDGTFEESSTQSGSAYLGVTVSEISEEASRMYNLPEGLYVSSVAENSPAAAAGIQVGDVISSIDGTAVTTYDELASELAQKNVGDVASVTINRTSNGMYNQSDVQVTLGSKPEQ